jgi:hypothetical protein
MSIRISGLFLFHVTFKLFNNQEKYWGTLYALSNLGTLFGCHCERSVAISSLCHCERSEAIS